MEENYVGKSLNDDKGNEFIILSQVRYKSLPCVYAMKNDSKEDNGEKTFFQVIIDKNPHLMEIKSEKMKKALYDLMFKEKIKEDTPRKIKGNESITDYFAYLDDYYKTKVTTILQGGYNA